MRLELSIRTWHRFDDGWDDDTVGHRFVGMVRRAFDHGPLGAAGVIVRPERVDLLDLAPVVRAGADVRVFLAALTRAEAQFSGPVEAVGVIGRFQARRRGEARGLPLALVFLEWSDNRWWSWKALIDPRGDLLREDTVTVQRAVDGAARPAGLGGWWTLGRRAGLRGRIEPHEPVVVH